MPFDVDALVEARVKVAVLKAALIVEQDRYGSLKLRAEMDMITILGPDGLGANKEIRDRTLAIATEADTLTQESLARLHETQAGLFAAEALLDGLRDQRRQLEFEQRERLGISTPEWENR